MSFLTVFDWRDGSTARARRLECSRFISDDGDNSPDDVYRDTLLEHRTYRLYLEDRTMFSNNCALSFAKIVRLGTHLTYDQFERLK